MTEYQKIAMPPGFVVEVNPYPAGFDLTEYEKLDIDGIWRRESDARASKIFNGEFLNFVSLEPGRLVGEFVEYKFLLAQLRDPELKEKLQIRPVSVSAITLAGEKVLFGKRSEHVTTDKGAYETVPSGGIDSRSLVDGKIDLHRQFTDELWEETGISVTDVKNAAPFALIYDALRNSYEICGEILVNYNILKEELPPNEEYDSLTWVSKSDLQTFVAKHQKEILPFSIFLLKEKRLLRT
jgi:hypothetical protein